MGRLSEYDDFDREELRSTARDEYLTRAYIDGRNAARGGKSKIVPTFYAQDSLAVLNWETGFDDWTVEMFQESL